MPLYSDDPDIDGVFRDMIASAFTTPTPLPGGVLVAFYDHDRGAVVAHRVDSLSLEHPEYMCGELTVEDADPLLAFGDVSAERLLQLTQWSREVLGEDLDLVGFAGGTSLSHCAIDGLEHLAEYGAGTPPEPPA